MKYTRERLTRKREEGKNVGKRRRRSILLKSSLGHYRFYHFFPSKGTTLVHRKYTRECLTRKREEGKKKKKIRQRATIFHTITLREQPLDNQQANSFATPLGM
jgi:hypothetical protein